MRLPADTARRGARRHFMPRVSCSRDLGRCSRRDANVTASHLHAAGLKGFEIAKRVHLDTEQFSVENDCMTPSFKLKRPQLKKKYADQIKAMYSALG